MMPGLRIQHKRNFHVVRWLTLLVTCGFIVAYAYFGIRWYNTGESSPLPIPIASADASVDESTVTEKQIADHTVPPDEPRYLGIPQLGVVSARIMKVGVTDRQMLDTPSNVHDIGWYTKSAKPGDGVGALVMSLQSMGTSGESIFAKLDSLQTGDQVSVERGDGKVFTYEIYDVREKTLAWVNQSGMKEMMYSADPSKEGLSLIAASGTWIPKDRAYDHRVLVRATLVEQ